MLLFASVPVGTFQGNIVTHTQVLFVYLANRIEGGDGPPSPDSIIKTLKDKVCFTYILTHYLTIIHIATIPHATIALHTNSNCYYIVLGV